MSKVHTQFDNLTNSDFTVAENDRFRMQNFDRNIFFSLILLSTFK